MSHSCFPHRIARDAQRWVAGAVLLAACAFSAQASAQTVTVPTGQKIKRDQALRDDSRMPAWINYDDCVADDVLYIAAAVTNATTNTNLQVWASAVGTDCTTQENRNGTAANCWLVFEEKAVNGSNDFPIRAQDVVAQNKPGGTDGTPGPGSGTAEDCENGLDQTAIELEFLLVDGTGTNTSPSSKYTDTGVDVEPPTPPTNVSIANEESSLRVSFSSGGETDLLGYDFYCDATGVAPTTLAPSLWPQQVQGDAATAGSGGAAGDAAASAVGGTGLFPALLDGGLDAASPPVSADSGSGSSATNPQCPSAAISAGQLPDPGLRCGSVRGRTTTSGRATGLTNNTTYAVAVAGIDSVGNVGRLSVVQCGTPEVINDFFELYNAAGGKGGGGFCSIGPSPEPWALGSALAICAVALGIRRRRPR